MTTFSDSKWQDVLKEVAHRAAIDADFRSLALKDSAAAISKVSDLSIPSGTAIKFVENTSTVKTVVLPDAVSEISQLSEIELENVAGGSISVGGGANWTR